MPLFSRPRLLPACWLLMPMLILAASAHGAAPPLDAEARQQLLRLQQLELASGQPLELDTLLCMDAQLGPAWKLPGSGALPPSRWQAVAERLRLAAEQCAPPEPGQAHRDTAAWRAALQGKLRQREQLEAEQLRLRACVAQAADTEALHRCVQAASASAVSPEAWQRWLTIYANRPAA